MDNILILSCSTGEGHNSAARAIKAVLDRRGIPCEMADPVAFQSKRMEHLVAALYNNTIRKKPKVFGAVYRIGNLYSNSNLPSPVYWANAHYSETLKAYILEKQFTAVICTHLYGLEAMTAIHRKGDFNIPFYGVLTDYTSIPFMDETEPTAFFAPNQDTKQFLIDHGVQSKCIHVSGIPVDESFRDRPDKATARQMLELPQDKKIFLVMSGGVGCENMEGLCDRLLENLPDNSLLLLLTGKNQQLKDRLDKKYQDNPDFRTVAFTRQVPIYMACADVLLSKPGGLSTTEAAVANVPLVHINAIPGCETCNARYFSSNGMALWAKDNQEAVLYALDLVCNQQAAQEMLTQQRKLINPEASSFIVDKVVGVA